MNHLRLLFLLILTAALICLWQTAFAKDKSIEIVFSTYMPNRILTWSSL